MNRRLRNIKSLSLSCLLLVAGVSAPLSFVQATDLTGFISNAGFEDNTTDGRVKDETSIDPAKGPLPLGWDIYNPGDISYFFGTYVPGDGDADEYSNTSPTTDQILYVDINSTDQGPNGPNPRSAGFEQELGIGVEAGIYNLSVAVGNPRPTDYPNPPNYDYSGFGGYGLELFARVYDKTDPASFVETLLLGDLTSSPPDIGEGLFGTVSFTATVESSPTLMDAILGIRLFGANNVLTDPSGNPITALSGIGFDNVTLSVSPVPVPAAVWLFGTAILGLFGFNRRRKITA
jgi:hypothetical protein